MTERDHTIADEWQFLSEHPLLGCLEPEDLAVLLRRARVERFAEGEVLFRRGDPGDRLFAVLAGRIMIGTPLRRDKVDVLNVLGKGRVFGELALMDGRERTADAVALADSRLLVLERGDFLFFLNHNGAAAAQLIAALCTQLRSVCEPEWYEATRLSDVPARLARKLLLLADVYGKPGAGGLRIGLKLSQGELGQMTGASRESINAHLRSWRRQSLIEIDGGTIVIRDANGLERIVAPR